MDKWQNTANRFIGFIDIMGFKDYVYRNSHEAVSKKMALFHNVIKENETFLQGIGQKANKEAVIRTTIFSDAILVISENSNEKSLEALSAFCATLFTDCMKKGIPVKGAISKGKVTADFDKSLFYGKALIDAYLLGEECYMYGIIADNKVEKIIKKNGEKFKSLFISGKVPTKSGLIQHYAINWFKFTYPEDKRIEFVENFYDSVSGKPRRYVDNTIDFTKTYFVDIKST